MITYSTVQIRIGQSAVFNASVGGEFKIINYYQGRFAGVDKSFVLPAQSNKGFTQVRLLMDGPSLIGMVAEIVFSPVTAFESLAIF